MTEASCNPDRIHVVIIPVYGFLDPDFQDYCENLGMAGFNLILVNNNEVSDPQLQAVKAGFLLQNANRGGVAGGFNRGVEHALLLQADWVTLLDQDSRIDSNGLHRLADLLQATPAGGVVVVSAVGKTTTDLGSNGFFNSRVIRCFLNPLLCYGRTLN